VKAYRSQFVELRGMRHHVLAWGDPSAPKLFLLHGWMDVGASFQFLVEALANDFHVVAPDLRGFGRSAWQPQGYWFADYVADLDALLDRLAPDGAVDLGGHSLGGNIVMQYAGARPERVRRLISLEGFGLPEEPADRAPHKYARWLAALRDPPRFRPYASLAAVADRLQQSNRRLPRDRAVFLARHWAEELGDGRGRGGWDPRPTQPGQTV
jgi:pimeloyl-ACP methyl ester carboxylesterase